MVKNTEGGKCLDFIVILHHDFSRSKNKERYSVAFEAATRRNRDWLGR